MFIWKELKFPLTMKLYSSGSETLVCRRGPVPSDTVHLPFYHVILSVNVAARRPLPGTRNLSLDFPAFRTVS